jgi:hypothetical protein
MSAARSVEWNDGLQLVFSDVDETVADLYRPAETAMLDALARLLDQGTRLVFITGQSVANVEQRVVMGLPASLRHRVAVGACSGAELWGYSIAGDRNSVAFDSVDTALSGEQKAAWRKVVQQLLAEFQLVAYRPMPIPEFGLLHGDEPWHVMVDDRGPQITIEFPNAYRLSRTARERMSRRLGTQLEESDLRIPISQRARQLLEACSVPVSPRLAGIFALDLAILGVSKTRAVEISLSPKVLHALGLGTRVLGAGKMEVWGDRFSHQAGTDWLMCTILDRKVRAISFRDEDPAEFPQGYNIQLWDGECRLQAGLLEFLQTRA